MEAIFISGESVRLSKLLLFVCFLTKQCFADFFLLFLITIKETAAISITNRINNGSGKKHSLCLLSPA